MWHSHKFFKLLYFKFYGVRLNVSSGFLTTWQTKLLVWFTCSFAWNNIRCHHFLNRILLWMYSRYAFLLLSFSSFFANIFVFSHNTNDALVDSVRYNCMEINMYIFIQCEFVFTMRFILLRLSCNIWKIKIINKPKRENEEFFLSP